MIEYQVFHLPEKKYLDSFFFLRDKPLDRVKKSVLFDFPEYGVEDIDIVKC